MAKHILQFKVDEFEEKECEQCSFFDGKYHYVDYEKQIQFRTKDIRECRRCLGHVK